MNLEHPVIVFHRSGLKYSKLVDFFLSGILIKHPKTRTCDYVFLLRLCADVKIGTRAFASKKFVPHCVVIENNTSGPEIRDELPPSQLSKNAVFLLDSSCRAHT